MISAKGSVQGIGITPYDSFPENPKFFTVVSVSETAKIPERMPDSLDILSIMVEAEIIKVHLKHTIEGISKEGQELKGFKLVCDVQLKQNIKYAANPKQSIHSVQYKRNVTGISVAVPPEIKIKGNKYKIQELFNQKRLTVLPYIEDIRGEQMGQRSIFNHIIMMVDVKVI